MSALHRADLSTTASALPNRRIREYMVPALTSALSSRDGAPSALSACVSGRCWAAAPAWIERLAARPAARASDPLFPVLLLAPARPQARRGSPALKATDNV